MFLKFVYLGSTTWQVLGPLMHAFNSFFYISAQHQTMSSPIFWRVFVQIPELQLTVEHQAAGMLLTGQNASKNCNTKLFSFWHCFFIMVIQSNTKLLFISKLGAKPNLKEGRMPWTYWSTGQWTWWSGLGYKSPLDWSTQGGKLPGSV
jgi:hypothetical protein